MVAFVDLLLCLALILLLLLRQLFEVSALLARLEPGAPLVGVPVLVGLLGLILYESQLGVHDFKDIPWPEALQDRGFIEEQAAWRAASALARTV